MTSVGTLGRRACALLAAGSAALHAVMLGQAANVIAAGLVAAMVTSCLYCATELWRGGSARAWVVVALMNLAMIAIHLPTSAHNHAGGPVSEPSTLMEAATLVAFIEVLAAGTALYLRSRVIGRPGR